MNYKDYGISETLTEKVKNAMIEQYAQEVEATKEKVENHFVSKGYSKEEIETEILLKVGVYSDNRMGIEIVSSVPGNVKFSKYVEKLNNNITVLIDGFSPDVNNTKKLNDALIEVQTARKEAIQEKVNEAELKFMELKKLPSHLVPSIHGAEVSYNVIKISIDGKNFDSTEKMKVHYAFLKKQKEEKEAAEQEQKAAAEKAAREALNAWATENGSDLLKLRIKHQQNWMHLAQTEWALAHSTGFNVMKLLGNDDSWPVNNATIDQLEALETAEAENPDHNIEIHRFKWVEDYDEVTHRTFLTCDVKTPTGNITLYKEIDDASSDDDE